MWYRIVLVIWAGLVLVGCAGAAEDGTGAATPVSGVEADTLPTLVVPLGDVALADEQVVAEASYAFRPVATWAVETRSGIAAISPPTASPATGPSIVLTVGTLEDLNIEGVSTSAIASLDELIAALLKSLDMETTALTLEPPAQVAIGGQPGQVVRFRSAGFGNLEGAVGGQMAAALLDGGRVFVMLGIASPPEQWQAEAEFIAVLGSMRFVLPAAE